MTAKPPPFNTLSRLSVWNAVFGAQREKSALTDGLVEWEDNMIEGPSASFGHCTVRAA